MGYDWDGNKILKPASGDQLDNFLQRLDDPDFWRTVKDPQTGQDVVLSDADVALIRRIQAQKIPDDTFDEYAVSNKVSSMVSRIMVRLTTLGYHFGKALGWLAKFYQGSGMVTKV